MASSQDGTRRDEQHGHFAETGFAARHSAHVDVKGSGEPNERNAAQIADSDKAEATQPVGEAGVPSQQQGAESSGRHKAGTHGSSDESKKGQRRNQNPRDADASSGDKATPMGDEAAEGSAQLLRHKASPAHTKQRGSKAAASTATPVAAHVVSDGLPSRKSGLEADLPSSGADASTQIRGTAPDAATDQSAKATKGVDEGLQAGHAAAEGIETASLQAVAQHAEAATSSGAHLKPLSQLQRPLLNPACSTH